MFFYAVLLHAVIYRPYIQMGMYMYKDISNPTQIILYIPNW